MIERGSGTPPASVRDVPSRPAQTRRNADPEAVKRFNEFVSSDAKAKEPQPKTERPHRRAERARDREADGNPLAQLAGTENAPGKAERGNDRGDQHDPIRTEVATDPQQRAQAGPAPIEASARSGPMAPEAAFTAMLDRVHLQGPPSAETILGMNDARWLAREAVISQSSAGGLSLSLSMNADDGSDETLDELRRRLEARGLSVERIDDSR